VPTFEVYSTRVADAQLRELRGEVRRRAKDAMDNLERRGCAAADWRLEGWRSSGIASLTSGVYRRLYASIGIDQPTAAERVGHPPCCPTGEPPVDPEVLERFVERTRELRRESRGRRRRG
jgi:hypothetical protein